MVRLRCSAIGPSLRLSAAATSPSLPSVGIWVFPTGAADGDAEGDAPAEADGAEGAAEADAAPTELRSGDGCGAEADGRRTLRRPTALTEADGAAEPLPVGRVATGVAVGTFVWRPTICSVLISMNPEPVVSAVASRPCLAKTALTWSGVTAGSSNRISQRVPPV